MVSRKNALIVAIFTAAILATTAVFASGFMVYDNPAGADIVVLADETTLKNQGDLYEMPDNRFFRTSDVLGTEVFTGDEWPWNDDGVMIAVTKPGAKTYELTDEGIMEDEIPSDEFPVLSCDQETRTVTLTIENTGDKEWDFTQSTSWTNYDDRANTRLFINGYEANKPMSYADRQGDGTLFYDRTSEFEDVCTGDGVLSPGEQMTCTLSPVPLETKDNIYGNAIWMDVPAATDPVYFWCD